MANDLNKAQHHPRRTIFLFLAIAFLSVTAVYLRMWLTGNRNTAPLMWVPGVAAIIVMLLCQHNVRGMGWSWGKTRYQMLGILLPPIVILPGILLAWTTGLRDFNYERFGRMLSATPGEILSVAILIILGSAPALGEELAWRGLLVPELAKITTLVKTALISAVIWTLYHYPAMLFFGYRGKAPLWYESICFAATLLPVSYVMAWLRLKSGSLWTAVFFHASHNLSLLLLLGVLTVKTGQPDYVLGEFGCILTVSYGLAAFLFWRKAGSVYVEWHESSAISNEVEGQV